MGFYFVHGEKLAPPVGHRTEQNPKTLIVKIGDTSIGEPQLSKKLTMLTAFAESEKTMIFLALYHKAAISANLCPLASLVKAW